MNSRLLEMIDATMARTHSPGNLKIDENLPIDLKYAITAVFAVKLALFSQTLPRSAAEDLRDDFSAILAITLGPGGARSPGFRAAYDAASKDVIDCLQQRRGGL